MQEKSPPVDGQFVPLLRVIIVDDHPSFRSMAARLLTKGGFSVIAEAADGATALSSIQELGPDLVLLDVQLPDIDGFQVADALAAAARAGRALPPSVVLMSSRASTDYGPRVAAAPVLGFIAKADLSGPAVRALLVGSDETGAAVGPDETGPAIVTERASGRIAGLALSGRIGVDPPDCPSCG